LGGRIIFSSSAAGVAGWSGWGFESGLEQPAAMKAAAMATIAIFLES
jgi:hypothetical protein